MLINISIHAPRGGSDCNLINNGITHTDFNPRSPWGERPDYRYKPSIVTGISIHAPRGGSDDKLEADPEQGHISIHAPRGGSDRSMASVVASVEDISIHAPRGGSDLLFFRSQPSRLISIHAPRGGSDLFQNTAWPYRSDFNPRSPWGERLVTSGHTSMYLKFQSTLPVGGATGQYSKRTPTVLISIHAPRGGSDSS